MRKLSKLLLTLTFALSITSSAFAVTVVSWGGAYTESQKLGYGDPTAKKLGIPVNWVDYTGGLSEIKAQKEACLLYTSPSPRDGLLSRMPSSA